jgi:hypothetical protein
LIVWMSSTCYIVTIVDRSFLQSLNQILLIREEIEPTQSNQTWLTGWRAFNSAREAGKMGFEDITTLLTVTEYWSVLDGKSSLSLRIVRRGQIQRNTFPFMDVVTERWWWCCRRCFGLRTP